LYLCVDGALVVTNASVTIMLCVVTEHYTSALDRFIELPKTILHIQVHNI